MLTTGPCPTCHATITPGAAAFFCMNRDCPWPVADPEWKERPQQGDAPVKPPPAPVQGADPSTAPLGHETATDVLDGGRTPPAPGMISKAERLAKEIDRISHTGLLGRLRADTSDNDATLTDADRHNPADRNWWRNRLPAGWRLHGFTWRNHAVWISPGGRMVDVDGGIASLLPVHSVAGVGEDAEGLGVSEAPFTLATTPTGADDHPDTTEWHVAMTLDAAREVLLWPSERATKTLRSRMEALDSKPRRKTVCSPDAPEAAFYRRVERDRVRNRVAHVAIHLCRVEKIAGLNSVAFAAAFGALTGEIDALLALTGDRNANQS